MQVRSLGWEDPLEEEMTTHSSTRACKIPWKEEAGGLQSMESQRVRHDLSDQESARQGIKVGNNPQHCVSHRRIHICMSIFQRYTCKSAKSFKLSSFIHSFLVIPQPSRNHSFPSTYFMKMSFIFIFQQVIMESLLCRRLCTLSRGLAEMHPPSVG